MDNLRRTTLTSLFFMATISPLFASATSQKEEIKREMEELASKRSEYLNKLGMEHQEAGDHAASIAAFEKIIKNSPHPTFVDMLNYAYALNEGNRLQDAFKVLSRILPESIEGLQDLIKSNPMAATKQGGSLTSHEIILDAYGAAGTIAYQLGKYEDALKYFMAVDFIEKEGRPPIVREETKLFVALCGFNAGYELNNQDYIKISFQYFKNYFDLNPKHIILDFYLQGAQVAYDSGEFDASELWMRKVLDTIALTQRVDEISVKELLTKVVRNLGGHAFKAQKYDNAYYFYKALMTHSKSLNLAPMDFYNAGVIADKTGHHGDAIQWLEKALTLNLSEDTKERAKIMIARSKAAGHH